MIQAEQIRAARALLGWSQQDLVEKSGLSFTTIKRMESIGPGRSAAENVAAVQKALESAGVTFIPENGGGAGVRMAKPRDTE
ncbi:MULTISPECIES: helix-turn-helix transcriptional regulator [unclassified Rhizobium]|uniref:helix-turn-helix domain-containing protein n=1 Tax=unclassified Rhizobium TaxID=2613769 RepID=UPI00115F585D|nr:MULTISPECIES: helix-turn-helix transcriptional regulator [unclassified Rhizobium]TQX88457.1 XRE family transcriptional regulator [Rhizobium sp. rho-13.1]TQY12652.1 XRE family transcriptional regulator [Rhizobium sp. rho-1.1]